MELPTQLETILYNSGFVLLYLIIFFVGKWLKGTFSSYKLDEQLTQYDNNAVSVSVAGYFIGLTAIFLGAINGPSSSNFVDDYLNVTAYSLGGIFLLNISRIINGKLILYKFSVDKEIIKDQNPGTGVVEAGVYVASGLIISGAISGEGGSPLTALIYYLIGQACLVLFAFLYIRTSSYAVHEEIEKDNTAAGLGFSGGLISIGIILMKAVSGDFYGWKKDLTDLGLDILLVFIYLLAIRLIFDRLILRDSDLNTEIANDQNLGAGLLEMVVAICFSSILYFVI
ncbi:MAG: DUF350 domain-containing protein [Bacteroidia bacterium]|nr:DUF350 domain-containing protein [Bacteroidia bacterium]